MGIFIGRTKVFDAFYCFCFSLGCLGISLFFGDRWAFLYVVRKFCLHFIVFLLGDFLDLPLSWKVCGMGKFRDICSQLVGRFG